MTTALSQGNHDKPYLYADILAILSGLLFILGTFYGGCVWISRTTALPVSCTQSFLPLSIIALLLSFAHVALMAALATVMILYSDAIINPPEEFEDSLNTYPLWALGCLGLWAICFIVALIPTLILFRRKYYRSPNNTLEWTTSQNKRAVNMYNNWIIIELVWHKLIMWFLWFRIGLWLTFW